MTTSNFRRIIASLAVLASLSGLSACTKTKDATPDPNASASTADATVSESTDATPTDEPSSTQVFTDMGDDFAGILSDVTTEKCPVEKGAVEAKGTVVNSAKKARDIFIGVIWLKKDSGDSVDGGLGEFTAKNVGPGETVKWSVKAELGQKPGRCVLQAKSNKAGTLK
jgi:hypothetical protein